MPHSEAFEKLVADAKSRVREIAVDEVKGRLDAPGGAVIVDTREDSEWARGHLPGAIHLGRGIIERDVEHAVADKDTTLILYCGGGYRSALAADNLQKMGYRNVYSMAGGWREWTGKGLPTVTG